MQCGRCRRFLGNCIAANRRFCKEGGLGYRSRPISRVLSSDSHSSRPAVADRLKQPTRMLGEQRRGILFGLAADGVWPATDCCQPHGALLPHHFTLTCAALLQPSAVMLSVPLSVASRRPAVSRHPALCSPDFPPRPKARRLSGRLRYGRDYSGLCGKGYLKISASLAGYGCRTFAAADAGMVACVPLIPRLLSGSFGTPPLQPDSIAPVAELPA